MNMDVKKSCEHVTVVEQNAPVYEMKNTPGIKLILVDSVLEKKCQECGEVISVSIPNMEGLFAAAAITRVKNPIKLNGAEIKFIRKALELQAKQLATYLVVDVATLSRWENDKAPITASYEKMFRLLAAGLLISKAPAIPFGTKEIADMKIKGIRPVAELTLAFAKVRMVNSTQPAYQEAAA